MNTHAFFADFALALDGDDDALAALGLAAHPGFRVYGNTVLGGAIDALEANYPAVVRLVGRDWFRAAAAQYAREAPPRDSRLMVYGEGFGDFLARFAPAADWPYLAGVAQLDRAWTEAHLAAQAPALDAHTLATLAPEQIGRARLAPHPAARWRWFDAMPIHTLWAAQRDPDAAPLPAELAWQGEGALITRPGDAVRACALSAAGCCFLDHCAAGATLADAAEQALAHAPDTDIAALLALLLRQGAFLAPGDTP
jgi:hypothetical protein